MLNLNSLDRWSPYMLAALRIVTALIFMEHGTQKLLGFPSGSTMQPPLFSMFGFAGLLELVGGLLILLGLFTRPVAFILAGEMAFAYFMGHAARGVFPVNNGGDAAILYCFVFLYFVFSGPGAWGLDRTRSPTRAGHAYGG